MLQRIQTLWLVLAACCMAMCFLTPVAKYHMEIASMEQTVVSELNLITKDAPDINQLMIVKGATIEYGQQLTGFATWPLIVLACVVIGVAVVSILLFKNRVAQMRIVAIGFLLNVVYVFLVFFWAVDAYADAIPPAMHDAAPQVTWMAGAYLPIASLVFFVLAHRGIKKDEAKVRAADRLR